MKKIFALFLAIIFMLAVLSACDKTDKHPKIDLSDTENITVQHYLRGNEENWTIEDKTEIEDLSDWFANLSLDLKKFEKGNSPGDSDGGEIYVFSSDSSEFSYIKNGPTNCYILYGSDWYQVNNPTDPF